MKRFGLKSPEGSASFGESAKEGKRFPLKSLVKPKYFASQPRERESSKLIVPTESLRSVSLQKGKRFVRSRAGVGEKLGLGKALRSF